MSSPLHHHPSAIDGLPSGLVGAEPPIVSVYLNTRGALPDAAEQVAIRWKTLRRDLVQSGASEASVAAIDDLVDGAHVAGETLVAISNGSGLLYTAHLPELPDVDVAVLGALPHLTPFIEARQRMIRHLVVATDRIGAEIIAVVPDGPDELREVTGDELHITRSAPGGWSQRRFQQRAENRWEANAREVADEVVKMCDAYDPQLVVVSGDVRAVGFLREHLPSRVTDLLFEVQGDYRSVDEAIARSAPLLVEQAGRDTAAMIEAWSEQSGTSGQDQCGIEAVLEALSAGRVQAVLVDPVRLDGVRAWFDRSSNAVAGTREALLASGVAHADEASLVDVVVRAALLTKAEVRVVRLDELTTGLGVLLRY